MSSDAQRVLEAVRATRPLTASEHTAIIELVEALERAFQRRWTELEPVLSVAFPDDGGVIAQDEVGCWYLVRDGEPLAFRYSGGTGEVGRVGGGAVRWQSAALRRLIWLDYEALNYAAALIGVLVGVGLALGVDLLAGVIAGPLLWVGLLGARNWAVKRHNRQVLGSPPAGRPPP